MRRPRWYFNETFLIAIFGFISLIGGTFLASTKPETAVPVSKLAADVIEQIKRPPLTITVIEPAVTQKETGTEGIAVYRSAAYGFEIAYPAHLKVHEGYFEPYTTYVLWQNPREGNAIVNIIYVQEGSSAFSDAELAKGESVSVGGRKARRFSSDEGTSLYWVSVSDYALAIYYERPSTAGSAYNEWVDISSIKF